MQEKTEGIRTSSGVMETFMVCPDGSGPYPVVVLYMDAPGIREELFDFARRIGTLGYLCLVPDLYYRDGKIRYDLTQATEETRADISARWRNLTNGQVLDDTLGMLDFLAEEPLADKGFKGSIGYCMSGQFVLSVAGHFPEHFRATASLHGVRNVTDQPDSPHLLVGNFRGELYIGFAEHDYGVPLTEVEALKEAMTAGIKEADARWQIEVHPGTEHGYSFPGRPVFDKPAAERNWERIFAMFHRQIPPVF